MAIYETLNAIELGIGHLKRKHGIDLNRLKRFDGDRINANLSATGMNFLNLLWWTDDYLCQISFWAHFLKEALFVKLQS